ncbi:sulfate/molybdate ABC transporter ATP-binding protein [Aeoliella sp. SH292]|uniref:sulfate/molybdate ABC transporter ATP-binding protein n=1 Tax=Aeoliella sp. SH292 TaxID=3454464 RepID=UPI003F9CB1E0
MSIEVKNISKTFGGAKALDDVSLRIEAGELVALLGPSGSGKTTLLRVMAGLESPDANPAAMVSFHDEEVSAQSVGERNVGFVFQHYALFRHMTVFENVAFGLRVKPRKERLSEDRLKARVDRLLSLVQLLPYAKRYPSQLSGGQRQRVALARALAVEPKILLLDEPFGALDAKVRQELRQWLRKLHQQMHVTTVLVTHDQEEALEVADKVVVMNQGKIEQHGRPDELFHHARTPFVMEFLGQVNVFQGRVQQGVATAGDLRVDYPSYEGTQELAANVYLRPHDIVIRRTANGEPSVPATIERINAAGSLARITLVTADGKSVLVDMSLEELRTLALNEQESVHLYPKQAKIFVAGEEPKRRATDTAAKHERIRA